MRRIVIFLGVAVALGLGVKLMADATMNKPDEAVTGSTSVVEFEVSIHDFQRGKPAAANALWAVCSATVPGDVSPLPEQIGDHWQVTIEPALGEHGEKRLLGCLEDLTIDRVVGTVVDVRTPG